jgi:hypothetical protein
MISTGAATYAPAIELKTIGTWSVKWQLQWVEWDKAAMTTGAFLPAASAAQAWLGTYDATLPWPNPIRDGNQGGTLNLNTLTFQEEADPQSVPPGDIDRIAYYPYLTGPFRDTAIATISYSLINESYNAYTTMYSAFNTKVTAYNTLKDAYNTELKKEKTRNSNFVSSIFDAPIKLPTRPCPPDQPPAFQGLTLEWGATLFSAYGATEKAARKAVPNANGTRAQSEAATLRSGFLQASKTDTSPASTDWEAVGHIFGRLG